MTPPIAPRDVAPIVALVAALAGGAAADPPKLAIPELAIPELAPPPAGSAVAVLGDGAGAFGDARTGGASGSLRVQARWQPGRTTLWLELGALAWRDHTRLATPRTLTGRTMTNPTLGWEWWTPARVVRGYARVAVMLPYAAAFQEPERPMSAPQDFSRDQLAPSQATRITALPFDRPTTTYGLLALGARWDHARGAVQAEGGLDLILPRDLNGQHGPLRWFALGAAATVTPRVALYGHALVRLSTQWDFADRDGGATVGLGANVAIDPASTVTAGLDQRVDACRLEGWGAVAPSSQCTRLTVAYTRRWP